VLIQGGHWFLYSALTLLLITVGLYKIVVVPVSIYLSNQAQRASLASLHGLTILSVPLPGSHDGLATLPSLPIGAAPLPESAIGPTPSPLTGGWGWAGQLLLLLRITALAGAFITSALFVSEQA
jgi:hypothetical protein